MHRLHEKFKSPKVDKNSVNAKKHLGLNVPDTEIITTLKGFIRYPSYPKLCT